MPTLDVPAYHTWVKDNFDKFNSQRCLCNWFPLRLLTEYASSANLHIRLRYWPGQAPTGDGERKWDTSKILVWDSNNFANMTAFYHTIKSTVTARMIGELNTVPITRVEASEGDLFTYNISPVYWHAEVIVGVETFALQMQSGSVPMIAPKDHGHSTGSGVPAGVYGHSPRRWDFAQFQAG